MLFRCSCDKWWKAIDSLYANMISFTSSAAEGGGVFPPSPSILQHFIQLSFVFRNIDSLMFSWWSALCWSAFSPTADGVLPVSSTCSRLHTRVFSATFFSAKISPNRKVQQIGYRGQRGPVAALTHEQVTMNSICQLVFFLVSVLCQMSLFLIKFSEGVLGLCSLFFSLQIIGLSVCLVQPKTFMF